MLSESAGIAARYKAMHTFLTSLRSDLPSVIPGRRYRYVCDVMYSSSPDLVYVLVEEFFDVDSPGAVPLDYVLRPERSGVKASWPSWYWLLVAWAIGYWVAVLVRMRP